MPSTTERRPSPAHILAERVKELEEVNEGLVKVVREARARMVGNSPGMKNLRLKADAVLSRAEGRA